VEKGLSVAFSTRPSTLFLSDVGYINCHKARNPPKLKVGGGNSGGGEQRLKRGGMKSPVGASISILRLLNNA